MFTELIPLIKNRTLMITVAEENMRIRLNVIPKSNKEEKNDISPRLVPLTVVASAQELDAQLATLLTNFTDAQLSLDETCKRLNGDLKLAQEQAEQEAKKRSEELRKRKLPYTPGKTTTPATATNPAPAKEGPAPQPDLFSTSPTKTTSAAPAPVTTQAATTATTATAEESADDTTGDDTAATDENEPF